MATSLNLVQKFFPNVQKVKDATRSIKIEVTRADARSRHIKGHKACAMAQACKRAFRLDGAVVSRTIAYLIKNRVATRYDVPDTVAREVVAFDRGATFAPGQYQLSRPVYRLGTRPNPTPGNRDGSRPGSGVRHRTTNIRASLGSA